MISQGQLEDLIQADAFFLVKSILIGVSPSRHSFVMTINFQVSKSESSFRRIKAEVGSAVGVEGLCQRILRTHLQYHPKDYELITLWIAYLEDFVNNPHDGLSLYRPEFQ